MSTVKAKDKTVKRKNVQVAVRIRPLSDIERSACNKNIVSCDRVARTVSLKAIGFSDSSRFGQGQKCFGPYDKIFGPESTQMEVYEGVLAPLMEDVINGYNCTVFAYGQTGSGKTYTMEGRHDTSEDFAWNTDPTAGIIPRALDQIFSVLGEDIDYTVRVSYVELYNEQIFDLLNQTESQLESLRIFDDKTKGVSIAGAEEVIVRSPKEIHELLRRGAEKRRTATTLMNMTSSRSHSVFTVYVMIREPGLVNGEELLRQGKLNLVDLAGSENIGRSGATDIRAREAGNINTSLLALGRVINALTMGASHIPYRESKLTRILQDSLGGKTITTIIATISPASSNFEESVNTLDYAQRAKNIKNNPEVNQRITRRGLLKEYNDEIDRLRRDLLAAREKHGIYLDKENYDQMIETIDENKAKVEELETQLEGKLRHVQILVEDFAVMDQHYKSIYEKFRAALTKLEGRKEEIEGLSLEIAQTKDNYNAASQALSVSCDSFVRLRSQALKLQTYCTGLYDQNGLLFNKIDEVLTTFDGNYQKLKELFDGQYKQFEIGRKQLATFTNKSEAQLNKAKTTVCALKELSDQFEQNIEKFTQDFRDRINQELDSLKDVATEHKNEFGKAIHSTLSTINKQVNDCALHSSEMSQLFDNTTQKMENFVEKEFFQIQSSGKTPERKSGKFTEVLLNIPPAEKLFEEQKGFITPKKDVNYKRRDSFLDSSFVSSLVSPDTLKCNLQSTNMVSSTKTGRLEPVDEEKKNECGTSLSFK
uniref:Kinesin-like protein n=1 Tax=Meloidogyne incognita TaxID=6306 RepID=A0A914LC50_MELIC